MELDEVCGAFSTLPDSSTDVQERRKGSWGDAASGTSRWVGGFPLVESGLVR